LLQRLQRQAQGLAQFFCACGRPHASRPRYQQRVVENVAQLGQVHAHRGLGKIQALCGAGDIVLSQQHVQGHQQIQIETSEIIHGNT